MWHLQISPPARRERLQSTGTPKILAVLIEFTDTPHEDDNSRGNIDTRLFRLPNTIEMLILEMENPKYPYESLAAYYDRSSYGKLDLSNGTTLDWYQTAKNRSEVSETTTGREDLIKEALNYYDTQGHDFRQYDNDGDGDIDYFIVI